MTDDLDLQVPQPRLLFDLDGTLVDSVYQHVIAWQEALTACGIELSVWRIHRRIGMSGGLFIDALLRETGVRLDDDLSQRLRTLHAEAYLRRHESVRAAAGGPRAAGPLHERGVPFAIATSGARHTAGSALAMLGLPDDVPVVTRDLVERAKPDPHLFLAAAQRLGVDPEHCFVVGDSVWDLLAAQRAGALGIGLLSGGYGREELERSGAYRVYADPAEMLTARGGGRPAGPLTPRARRGRAARTGGQPQPRSVRARNRRSAGSTASRQRHFTATQCAV